MKYLLIFLLSFNCFADKFHVEIREKNTNKLLAADTGESVTMAKVKEKMKAKGIAFNGLLHDISIVNKTAIENARKQNIKDFAYTQTQKDEFLLKLIKEYLERNDLQPEEL